MEEIVSNKFNNKQCALFFSGGLDSIDSYKRNEKQNPILITILQIDHSNNLDKLSNDQRDLIQKFSKQQGTEVHYIRSMLWLNSPNYIINANLLTNDFKIKWWPHVAYSFVLWALLAPISIESIGKILYASTFPKNYQNIHTQHFLHEYNCPWADIHILYDGNLSR